MVCLGGFLGGVSCSSVFWFWFLGGVGVCFGFCVLDGLVQYMVWGFGFFGLFWWWVWGGVFECGCCVFGWVWVVLFVCFWGFCLSLLCVGFWGWWCFWAFDG